MESIQEARKKKRIIMVAWLWQVTSVPTTRTIIPTFFNLQKLGEATNKQAEDVLVIARRFRCMQVAGRSFFRCQSFLSCCCFVFFITAFMVVQVVERANPAVNVGLFFALPYSNRCSLASHMIFFDVLVKKPAPC